MSLSDALLGLAMICVAWGVTSSIFIVSWLSKQGEKINYILLKLFIIKYVARYRELTVEKHGEPGFWYYSFTRSMMLTLVLAIAGIIMKLT